MFVSLIFVKILFYNILNKSEDLLNIYFFVKLLFRNIKSINIKFCTHYCQRYLLKRSTVIPG